MVRFFSNPISSGISLLSQTLPIYAKANAPTCQTQSSKPKSHPEIKRFEVTCIFSPPDATVDIVLVHGLNGHPEKTWTAKNGVFWPTDLLPASLKNAKARILVYGYNADVFAFGGDKSASSDMIHQHAQTLVSALAMERLSEDCGENAIIWVAHSLGGILVKRALELSNDLTSKSADPSRSIYVSTYGIIFLGTPHTGAEPAKWAAILQGLADAIIPKKVMDTEPHLLQTLKSNNETLQNINLHFLDIYQRFEVDMVHEAVKTDLKGMRAYVVDQTSASPQLPGVTYYGIEASHSTMCKFDSKNAPGYLNVSTRIRTWVVDCPPVIQSRWASERRARQQVRENEAKELLGIFPDTVAKPSQGSSANTPELSNSGIISTSMIHSVASTEPEKNSDTYFIKPPGFRPNSLFVGREAELAEMHKMLFDKKRRAEGTSAVLLQCLPGGGKSCLARQYVYTHFEDFTGGIFWVRAKSQEQLAAGFWDIARKVALKTSNIDGDATAPQDAQQFIAVVRDWFGSHHEWLLVLDGIHFDHSEELRRFIPDSKNSSLIYTSTERSVGGDHYFMNPQVIRIPLLSAREAQRLFLQELDKKNPTTDDLKHSMELVQRMGFLPLVIHAVAQRLKATEEPLARFARTYATGPKLRDLDTYKAVVEQLKSAGAFEALNLINVLCFFSQHIPVEMIVLGLKGLDVPTKAYEAATGRSLNNTIKILNRFALIERNEQRSVQSSQSSKGSRDFLADDIDVIKLHSVVQDFFADSLRAEGQQLPRWLERAIILFRRSYEMANTRIYSKTNAGLVGDYRSYEIHGKRLLEHLSRNEKKNPTISRLRDTLESCLEIIKDEIERRTKESSQDIAQGRVDAYQTSIFDRTSSSSDTGAETPAFDKASYAVYNWGTESHKDQYESPISITEESTFSGIHDRQSQSFPPLPRIEDQGYDSDRDEAVSMTVRPSQRTARPNDMMDSDSDRPIVRGRRIKERPTPLNLHRTIKVMEKNRYHDSAGAWRAVNPAAADPRVTHELAEAFIPKTGPIPPSRGRMSGQSQAEVALTHISKNSPPPIRGGGTIVVQDRRRSSQQRMTTDHGGHLKAGNATYAPAVAGDIVYTEMPTEGTRERSISRPSLRFQPATPAMNSLHQFPHSVGESMSPRPAHSRAQTSPGLASQPYPSSDTELYQTPSHHNQEDIAIRDSALIYPRQTGPLPIDYFVGQSSPLKRNLPHDYPSWHSQNYSSLPYPSNGSYRSPSPNPEALRHLCDQRNHLGILERDAGTYHDGGYTSQPMSRDPSGGSNQGGRQPSIAETEPLPQLPSFSPRIPLTSYQIYENMRERGNDGPLRKSPRLGYARVAHIGNVGEWTVPGDHLRAENIHPSRSRTPFNPAAPVFLPRTQSQPPGPARHAPPSPLSNPRSSPLPDKYHSQLPHHNQAQVQGAISIPIPQSSSGGVRVGRRMIGFGDFPELVDFDLARERAEKQRAELRAFDDGESRGRGGSSRNVEWERQRPRLMNVNGPPLTHARAVSDVENIERERPGEGRRRGLSSPERAVGICFQHSGGGGW